jgi:hypothetical protein
VRSAGFRRPHRLKKKKKKKKKVSVFDKYTIV